MKQVDLNRPQAIENIWARYQECFNKRDAVGLAATFTNDGALLTQTPRGATRFGTKAIV